MLKDGLWAPPLVFLSSRSKGKAVAIHPCFIAYMNIWCTLQLQQSQLLCAVRKGMPAGPSASASCSILGIDSAAARGLCRQKFVVQQQIILADLF